MEEYQMFEITVADASICIAKYSVSSMKKLCLAFKCFNSNEEGYFGIQIHRHGKNGCHIESM